jgi:hypothetical protein
MFHPTREHVLHIPSMIFPYFLTLKPPSSPCFICFFHEDEYIITVNPNQTMYKVPAVQPVFQSSLNPLEAA